MTNRHMFPLFVLGVMLFVTGCSTVRHPGEPIADLPPAPLPAPDSGRALRLQASCQGGE